MSKKAIAIILIALGVLIGLGFAYVQWSKSGPGAGLYSRLWTPEPVFGYWHPDRFYESVSTVEGTFEGKQCVECHAAVTPGIVKDWEQSKHSQAVDNGAPVYCSSCHGKDHTQLRMPSPDSCAGCHVERVAEFYDEKRFGFPSHALAMERAVDAKHFVDKPKAEVTACLQCHSVANKCDSCHTRHRFDPAEARRPEACITCHSGPPHPDDETYFQSAHGKLYQAEGKQWDWSKPLRRGNYKAPTCAYCHMSKGKHQVADKTIWQFGLKEVNPATSGNEKRRQAWVAVCADCHDRDWSAQRLAELDQERKQAWTKLYAAESLLKDLRSDGLLFPSAKDRPPYPNDALDRLRPRERIGFFEGQASAFYNVSPIERDYFEMWYFDNLAAYKGAAHGAADYVRSAHNRLDEDLRSLVTQADELRAKNPSEQVVRPGDHWRSGEYTDFNRESN